MTMRSLVYQALVADSTLASLGITGARSFAVDVDTPAARPFLQLRWGRNDIGMKDIVGRRGLVIWVHDQGGDYGRIDSIILRIRSLLPSLIGQSYVAGSVLQGVEWLGDSEDLTDDGHKTITRNVSFLLVGSGQ